MTRPVESAERITSLDAIRGIAVLGILTMNAVSYSLGETAYFNIDSTSPQSTLDWAIGGIGEIFFDQKFMGLFSMLFGAGIVLFADRVETKGGRPLGLSLWRNTLLFAIGMAHALLWQGDILTVYAVCAPVLLVLRRRSNAVLAAAGGALVLSSAVWALLVQGTVPASGAGLSSYWGVAGDYSDAVGLWLLVDFFARALGMMLIGIAAHRSGFLTGSWSPAAYRRVARFGLGVGLPLAAAGFFWVAAAGFGPGVAVAGAAPNTVATIPVVCGYVALIVLWHRRYLDGRSDRTVRAAGRMALTNYLTQTVAGVVLFEILIPDIEVTRTGIAVFVVVIWALQLWWSQAWLSSHRYGPAEWAWRVATYRRLPG